MSQSTSPLPQKIGIAVVESLGRYLVGIRPEGVPLAGYSEFPGGKCAANESPAQTACRECREETGLEVAPVDLLMRRQFTYEHGTVDLHFWLCRPRGAVDIAGGLQGYRWVPAAELKTLRFPEGNAPLIEFLSEPR